MSRVKNAKFSGYFLYMNTNQQEDFQICVSVPLSQLGGFDNVTGVNDIGKNEYDFGGIVYKIAYMSQRMKQHLCHNK